MRIARHHGHGNEEASRVATAQFDDNNPAAGQISGSFIKSLVFILLFFLRRDLLICTLRAVVTEETRDSMGQNYP